MNYGQYGNSSQHHDMYRQGSGPQHPAGVPPFTFQGWGYPQQFPNPPAYLQDPTLAQIWRHNLNTQYPASDPNRYHRAWTSWFSTPRGGMWNGHEHQPNWGPHQPLPMTWDRHQSAQNAAHYWTRAQAHLTPQQQAQAQRVPVMTTRTFDGQEFHRPYLLH